MRRVRAAFEFTVGLALFGWIEFSPHMSPTPVPHAWLLAWNISATFGARVAIW
jgi:hypothetical protein